MNRYSIFFQILKTLDKYWLEEYKFLQNRKFRFDFALPYKKIAVEIDGGIYNSGRHVRGNGYKNDMEKLNLAVLNGWKVLRFTPQQTNESKTIEIIKKLL